MSASVFGCVISALIRRCPTHRRPASVRGLARVWTGLGRRFVIRVNLRAGTLGSWFILIRSGVLSVNIQRKINKFLHNFAIASAAPDATHRRTSPCLDFSIAASALPRPASMQAKPMALACRSAAIFGRACRQKQRSTLPCRIIHQPTTPIALTSCQQSPPDGFPKAKHAANKSR